MAPGETPRARIAAILTALGELADEFGLLCLARDNRDMRLAKLNGDRVSLVVLGEFNHGKSTFVNALLGEPLMPVGATPTTAVLAELRHGAEFSAHAIFEDGARVELARPALLEVLRGAPPARGGALAVRVEIAVPSAFLADRLTLFDTPGVNDLSEQRSEITYDALPRADAIVFLLDATQVLTASEERFLRERVLGQTRERLVFVIAKSDLLDDNEKREVEAFARTRLAALTPSPQLFFVSAKQALAGRADASGLPALIEHLRAVLGRDRERMLVDRALADAGQLSRFLRQSLAWRRAAYALTAPALAERLAAARLRVADGGRAFAAADQVIVAETTACKARVQGDLSAFTEALLARLPRDLAAAEAADIERFLGPFIEDTFKRWLEQEAVLVGNTLDALSERVVTLASETLDAEIAGVTRDLDAAEHAFTVNAPALGVEASVFALGALGTTALLFVNVAMGGTLALLTPAFAAIARARAVREAKDRAREQAPSWVRQVSAALGDKLSQVIDGFAERLRAFIVEAGGALAKSIAEALAQVARERQEPTSGGDPAADPHGDRLALRLRAIDETITDLRQRPRG